MHAARYYQQNLIDDVMSFWARGGRNALGVLPTGGGKCLGKGTPVMLCDGTVIPVEDVLTGDLLMGPDGRPRRVLSLARGREPLYRIVPSKGDPYVVNESHVLSLKRTPQKANPKYPSQVGGEIVNVSVRDYLQRSTWFKHTHKGWRVGVDFPARPLPLDPYFLGVWLGDGNSHNASVTTGDPEIEEFLQRHAEALGMRSHSADAGPGCVTVKTLGLTRTGRGGTPVMNTLREIGVLNCKHIPWAFRTGSREQRLAVLAGLLDSDGHYNGKGFDLCLVNERLLDDAVYVARSLGFAAYKTKATKTCHNNGVVGTYWRTHISGDVDQIPCRLPRKQAAPRRQKKDVLVTGITVEPMGVGDYYGFEIDGDRLFLLGDFTVTHNTFVFSRIASSVNQAVCAIAHRGELVTQISTALAREGVRHRIIGPTALARQCTASHLDELGRDFVQPNSRIAAAGVDTLVKMSPSDSWFAQVGLWIQDEAHHVLKDNKWGKAAKLFPNARGLGVTATPIRADGKGLGLHADGLFEEMFVGPTMRELIDQDFLTDYKIYAPPNDLDLSSVAISAGGDFNHDQVAAARKKSRITGDVVQHYLRLARGKRGVTFDTDVDSATKTAQAFRDAGVPAEVVHGKTPSGMRNDILKRFARGEILQLVNVDLFGEGFDLPAIEVVSFARPTMSFALFAQQFGRALRKLAGKAWAIIIDHVGNTLRHGLPDAARVWSLDRRERRASSRPTDVIPTRVCLNAACNGVYERVHAACPYCGHTPIPGGRSSPELVDGDLYELDAETLRRMRGEVSRRDGVPFYPQNASAEIRGAIAKNHYVAQQAQSTLRALMATWAGWQRDLGRSDSESYRRFFFRYGLDVVSAQALKKAEAEALAQRIAADLNQHNIRGIE